MSLFLLVPLAIVQLVLLAFSLYLLFLTLASVHCRPRLRVSSGPQTRFAILVPAHNEEQQLPRLLESLLKARYPRDLYRTFVVADNCSDATAEVARSYGAGTFERYDTANKGKGYALRWLLEQVSQSPERYDAYLFVDADCQVSENFLNAMDRRFQSGALVLQGYYTVADPLQSEVSALRFIAMVLKHYIRPLGRMRLKLSCGLFGTGMGFKSSLLESQQWDAYSLTEDIEHFLQLTGRGVPVEFVPEAVVSSPMPTNLRDSRSQNLRWEKGRLQMLRKHGPRLIFNGVLQGEFKKIDAVAEQAIPPLSVAIFMVLGMLLLSWFTGTTWLVYLSVATAGAYLGHVFIGLMVAKVPLRTYWALVHVPGYVLWKLSVYVQALLPGRQEWTRTQR